MFQNSYSKVVKRFFINAYLLSLCTVLSSAAQSQENCSSLRAGLFYSYPKNSSETYVTQREGNMQKEVNLTQNDSTMWEVNWKDDCVYTLKYVSGGKYTQEVLKVLDKHKLYVIIEDSKPDYYVYACYLDSKSGNLLSKDTMWLQEKTKIPTTTLFTPVADLNVQQQITFSDTSKYALLYVYRPNKTLISLSNYFVYFDDIPMWVAQNNSGYLFKILKEGHHSISSRMLKASSNCELDVRFGKVYYVKAAVIWGVHKHLYNFKLETTQMTTAEGKLEFTDLKYR